MVQCGAVLERENGVDGFRVYLAVTWEDFMIFIRKFLGHKWNSCHLAGNVLCLSISEQGVDECQQASPAGANTVQGFASLQLLSNRVLRRWKKRELATEEEGILYHNKTATRTEMDSGDYEAPVSGCYNRLLI
ncbi:hypothetical protein ALC56_02147 [Trachymyrmex septentrionalis]|uniref:Uncharacterized protein n=1 Tax=Trachymyrmex septentrionalis TaxID=34720 RepID=A0A195FSK3_9HYME|nr:hypothetical protein ALC56_02147 [Trachymyrmex septentrionalis]